MCHSWMGRCSGHENYVVIRELSLYPQSLLAKFTVHARSSHSFQADIEHCLKWSRTTAMKFNTSKCVHMSFRKHAVTHLCEWESLQWRRQILSLVYFHHVFYQFPALLSQFSFTISSSCRHPSSIVLPRSGTHFFKSPLFGLSVHGLEQAS